MDSQNLDWEQKEDYSNWVVGECGGRQGYLPSSYVQLLPSDSLPQAVALYDFKLPDSSVGHAAGCLAFTKGEVLSVSRRVDHNWAEGSVAGRKGIFPVSFVQLNAAAAALLQSHPSNSLTPTTTTTTTADASRTPVSRAVESAVNVAPSDRSTASLPRSCGSLSSRVSQSSELRGQSRASVGNLNDDLPPLTIPANAGLPSSAAKTGANNMAMLYVARFPYVPQKPDEVALTKGCLYAVTQRCHDGWFKGRCLTTHKTGVFPGNYLQPARGQTIADYIARLNNKGTSPPSDSPSIGDAGGGSTFSSPAHAPAVRRTVSAGVATPASPVAGGDSSPHHLTHIYSRVFRCFGEFGFLIEVSRVLTESTPPPRLAPPPPSTRKRRHRVSCEQLWPPGPASWPTARHLQCCHLHVTRTATQREVRLPGLTALE
ncbi:SH3 domain [Trinorchestia longiramus]|nr:SH3 domain [Trinorchestia longiramus]